MPNEVVTLEKSVKTQVTFNFTPDLPALRYQKQPFKVLFVDSLGDKGELEFVMPDLDATQFRFVCSMAVTADKFYAFRNKANNPRFFESYVFSENFNPQEVAGVPKDARPMPVMGTVYEVDLDNLMRIDFFYDNTYDIDRKKVNIKMTPKSTQTYPAFMYLSSANKIAETYNQRTKKYEPYAGIQLEEFKLLENFGVYRF